MHGSGSDRLIRYRSHKWDRTSRSSSEPSAHGSGSDRLILSPPLRWDRTSRSSLEKCCARLWIRPIDSVPMVRHGPNESVPRSARWKFKSSEGTIDSVRPQRGVLTLLNSYRLLRKRTEISRCTSTLRLRVFRVSNSQRTENNYFLT